MKSIAAVVLGLLLIPIADAQVRLEPAFNEGGGVRLIDFRHDSDGRVFVGEQAGVIRGYERGVYLGHVLDISDRVGEASAEGGLQSFAFHPDHAENGYLYVSYVAVGPRRTVLARFKRTAAEPLAYDPESEVVLLEVGQPSFNHNGGNIAFGPDGYLYWPLGDGGNNATQAMNGQDPTTLLGSILRLDVDDPAGELPYGIPPSNPFASTDGPERDEIYAWGFRSPWRSSFDAETGTYWLGDVGQSRYEEVDIVERGGNYGWAVMEGAHCFDPPANCDPGAFRSPVWEYGREGGRSVTGGYVYRGSALPELVGKYVYGDFESGRVWALDVGPGAASATNTELLDTDFLISSFGEDADGELYVLDFFGDTHKIVRDPVSTEAATPRAEGALRIAGPNPVRAATRFVARPAEAGAMRVVVYDLLGRRVATLHDGPVSAAEVALRLDARTLAPGTYVVQMETASERHAVRVTVLR